MMNIIPGWNSLDFTLHLTVEQPLIGRQPDTALNTGEGDVQCSVSFLFQKRREDGDPAGPVSPENRRERISDARS